MKINAFEAVGLFLNGGLSFASALLAALLTTRGARTTDRSWLALACGLLAVTSAADIGRLAIQAPWIDGLQTFADILFPVICLTYVRRRFRDQQRGSDDAPVIGWGFCVAVACAMTAAILPERGGLFVNGAGLATWIACVARASALVFARRHATPGRFLTLLVLYLGLVLAIRLFFLARYELSAGVTGGEYLISLILIYGAISAATVAYVFDAGFLDTASGRPTGTLMPDEERDRIYLQIQRILIEQQTFRVAEFGIRDLAALTGETPRRLSYVINRCAGENVRSYINRARANCAGQVLTASPDRAIKVILYECGFQSRAAFNREFHRVFGLSPSAYRRERPGKALSS